MEINLKQVIFEAEKVEIPNFVPAKTIPLLKEFNKLKSCIKDLLDHQTPIPEKIIEEMAECPRCGEAMWRNINKSRFFKYCPYCGGSVARNKIE
jgi:ribosomal protein S27AE